MATFKENLTELRRINADLYAASREKGLDPSGVSFAQLHELWAQITSGSGNYQIKSAVPSDADVIVTADADYEALAKVLVEAAGNLQPHNIRKGITVFGKEGTMEVAVSSEVPDDFKSNDPENPDPGTVEDADREYGEQTGEAPSEDMFLLVDNNGNRTYGFLLKDAIPHFGYWGATLDNGSASGVVYAIQDISNSNPIKFTDALKKLGSWESGGKTLIMGMQTNYLLGLVWDDLGRLYMMCFKNPFGRVHASLFGIYNCDDLEYAGYATINWGYYNSSNDYIDFGDDFLYLTEELALANGANDGCMALYDSSIFGYTGERYVYAKRKSSADAVFTSTRLIRFATYHTTFDTFPTGGWYRIAPGMVEWYDIDTVVTPFRITEFNPATTDFKATGWRRLSWHTTGEKAGTWSYDDFSASTSGGGNYLKHIISSTRKNLYFSGMNVWPQNEVLFDATSLMIRGGLSTKGANGYVDNTKTNRMRVGCTENNTIVFPARTEIGICLNYGYDIPQWAMWFIHSSGLEKIAAGSDLVKGTDYTDTGWLYRWQTYVVPEDTQCIWLNFRESENANVLSQYWYNYILRRII